MSPTLPVAEHSGPGRSGDRVLGDRYRLIEPIGYGGMGEVYRAHDAVLDREVAVKLLGGALDHNDSRRGPVAEARAVARVAHPGIVHVFDAGSWEGTSYVVMELVPGRTLHEQLRTRGMLGPGEAADIAAQVADALDSAHHHSVIHCDVKPSNIIITPEGRAKLVDFGIARAAAAGSPLPVDEIMGSAAYVAPEQARGQPVDARADVYALGAVLYELITGQPPFQGHSAEEVLVQRLTQDPPAPRSLNTRISANLNAIVGRALARDPADRYQHAADMRDALRAECKRQVGVPAAVTQVMPRPHMQTRPPMRARSRVMSPPLIALLLAAAALAIIASSHHLASITGQGTNPTPSLVGHRVSEVAALLQQAGFAPGDTVVLTRSVDQPHVGLIVDQQPQPGQPLQPNAHIQIAVGVP